jgi:GABA(A) receptor-associated protein
MSFQQKYSFQKRVESSTRVLRKYPDRIPIICEHLTIQMEKNKFLTPKDMTVGEFMITIRSYMKLRHENAIFMFIDNIIPVNSMLLSQLYDQYKKEDGFLYITYSEENTFGGDPSSCTPFPRRVFFLP